MHFKLIKKELEKGNSVSLSLYPTCRGHIVRIQGIDNDGLTIDDPYGNCNLACKLDRESCKKGSYSKGESNTKNSQAGNNDFYSWEEISQITVKYMVIFSE